MGCEAFGLAKVTNLLRYLRIFVPLDELTQYFNIYMFQFTVNHTSVTLGKRQFCTFASVFLIGLLGGAKASTVYAGEKVEVFKNPSCGCCTQWAEHLRKSSFEVVIQDVRDIASIRRSFGMPEHLGACHTAIVGGYVVEGHVPAEDIKRLLRERPKAIGLAVPSMPPGSPGMESAHPVSYAALLVQTNGDTKIFAKH